MSYQENRSFDIDRSFKEIIEIVTRIGNVNSSMITETENLKLILLNLKIQNAHIKGHTGIEPIAASLEKTINSIHDQMSSLVSESTGTLAEDLKLIGAYLKEKGDWNVDPNREEKI